jgi:hypothetical protein
VVGRDGGPAGHQLSGAITRQLGGGTAIPDPLRRSMEGALGTSLTGVRLHTDETAARLSRQVSARAFTVGRDIFFGAGEYQPQTEDGQHTLAHELAHVGAGEQAGIERLTIHRLLSKSGRDVRAARSTVGRLNGSRTEDTLDRLARLLDDYPAERDSKRMLSMLQLILVLCNRYLRDNADQTSERKGNRVALVGEIKAEARREQGQLQAQQRYLQDAYGVDSAGKSSPTALTKQKQTSLTHGGAKALGAGTTDDTAGGATQATLALARQYGLTEAEMLAIRTYTASNYTYLNPAVAASPGWLESQHPEAKGDAAERKALTEEGTLHAGVAMSGLAKLEVKKGLTYRGARMTPEEFDKTYGTQSSYRFAAFASTACKIAPATAYANGQGGDTSPRPDQTVSVLCEMDVINGRDIRDLSVYGAREEEWLMLPGATFSIDRIEDVTDPKKQKRGYPPATAWKIVHMTQTK